MITNPSIRVTSFNLLADSYATKRLYPEIPPEILDWKHRAPLIVSRIDQLSPDVACLQEVEAVHWTTLLASLVPLGWDGIFAQKGQSRIDGCALLYRTGAASLMQSEAIYFVDGEEPSGHLALVGVFSTAIGSIRIATTHLRWQRDTSQPHLHIGYRQAAQLLARLSAADKSVGNIVCGDFNVSPQHPVIELFTAAGFCDAYAASPQFTCAPNARAARIDFILASKTLRAVGELLPVLRDATVMPTSDQPSDHLPITARIEIATADV